MGKVKAGEESAALFTVTVGGTPVASEAAKSEPTYKGDPIAAVQKFDATADAPKSEREQWADEWMAQNPDLVARMESIALECADRYVRFGIGLVAEMVRWPRKQDASSPSSASGEFKIPNAVRAYVARRLLAKYPQLRTQLTIRELRSSSAPDGWTPPSASPRPLS